MKLRATQPEQLDNLSLRGNSLQAALKSLAWVNQYLGNRYRMVKMVRQIIQDNPSVKHFHIVDLGCGGGDILLQLAKYLQKKDISFTLTGIDGNAFSLQYAEDANKSCTEINYIQADILNPKFKIPMCEILISSHFIYHFSAPDLVNFLKINMPSVRLTFINSGLERNPWASRLFKGFGFLFPLSKLAKEDGLLAIRRAFTKKELLDILEQTSYPFALTRTPFFRLMLLVSSH